MAARRSTLRLCRVQLRNFNQDALPFGSGIDLFSPEKHPETVIELGEESYLGFFHP